MSKKLLIKNAGAIVTCDAEDNVYYGCDILIEGPGIVEIGKNIQTPVDETIDASGKFIYPGRVEYSSSFLSNLHQKSGCHRFSQYVGYRVAWRHLRDL